MQEPLEFLQLCRGGLLGQHPPRQFRQPVGSLLGGAGPPLGGVGPPLGSAGSPLGRAGSLLGLGSFGIVGGLDPIHQQVRFDVRFNSHLARTLPIQLSSTASKVFGVAAAASAMVTADVNMNLDFSFGMDLANYLANPSQGFPLSDLFLQVNNFAASGSFQGTGMNFNLTAGFLQAGIAGGSINVGATGTIALQKPTGERKLDLQFIQSHPLSTLITLTPAGTLNATLPVAARLGDLDFGTAHPRITLTTANVFTTPPTVQFQNFDQMLNFSNLSAQDFLGSLVQLGAWFGQLQTSQPFRAALPVVSDTTSSNLFDLATAYATKLTNPLKTSLIDPNSEPTFASA